MWLAGCISNGCGDIIFWFAHCISSYKVKKRPLIILRRRVIPVLPLLFIPASRYRWKKPSSGTSSGTFIPLRYNRRPCRSLLCIALAAIHLNYAPPKPSSICSMHIPSQPMENSSSLCNSSFAQPALQGEISVMWHPDVLSFSMGLNYDENLCGLVFHMHDSKGKGAKYLLTLTSSL